MDLRSPLQSDRDRGPSLLDVRTAKKLQQSAVIKFVLIFQAINAAGWDRGLVGKSLGRGEDPIGLGRPMVPFILHNAIQGSDCARRRIPFSLIRPPTNHLLELRYAR